MVVGFLAVVLALVLIERSALVALEEVEVSGTERLTPTDVRDAAGLALGTSTLRLDLGAAEQRVEDLPLVRAATARRVNPLTVHLDVVERRPALVVSGAGQAVLVDREGVVIMAGKFGDLPVIELGAGPPSPGDTVAEDPALANAHAAWRGLSGPLRARVVRLEAAGANELELRLRDGLRVSFGRAERIDEKVRALGAVLRDVDEEDVARIDVRAPSAPVVVGP